MSIETIATMNAEQVWNASVELKKSNDPILSKIQAGTADETDYAAYEQNLQAADTLRTRMRELDAIETQAFMARR